MDGKLYSSIIVVLFCFVLIPTIHTSHAQETVLGVVPITFNSDLFDQRFDSQITFTERVQNVFRDIQQALTFDPLDRAVLNLEDAGDNQSIINRATESGVTVPVEVEERRVNKLNEALLILQENMDSISNSAQLLEDIRFLQSNGELNEIKILYSQIDAVKDADQATKDEYNKKVNSLETWQKYCFGDFNIDNFRPLDESVVPKIEEQCPRVKELNEQFDIEELYLKYKDDI